MNIFKNLFLFKKQSMIDNEVNYGLVDQYGEIAKLVKEARIKKNITIKLNPTKKDEIVFKPS